MLKKAKVKVTSHHHSSLQYSSKSMQWGGREGGVDTNAVSQSTTKVKVLLFPQDKHAVPYQLHTCKSRASLPSSNKP